MTIRNPIEWSLDQFRLAAVAMGSAGDALHRGEGDERAGALPVSRIGVADLELSLRRGVEDFMAYRTDVIFLCAIFPLMGLVIVRLASGYDMVPLLFPLASGFALIGPFAAVGLYEMSRRREAGLHVAWPDAFSVARSPAIAKIVVLGAILVAVFLIWLAVAQAIYFATFGLEPPQSFTGFARDVVATTAGWTLIVVGIGVGFFFAAFVLMISVVSFPLLIDRDVSLVTAVWTSVRAVAENPVPMALWGLIVAAGLVLGSIPAFLGLVIVVPILGHATWHLYRRVVPR